VHRVSRSKRDSADLGHSSASHVRTCTWTVSLRFAKVRVECKNQMAIIARDLETCTLALSYGGHP
jgi:hypothetical protein